MDEIFDIIIVGGGPAGLTASIYSLRAKMKVLMFEKALCGGQILATDIIENFPGFPDGITGQELAEKMGEQAKRLGLKLESTEVNGVSPAESEKEPFQVIAASGAAFKTYALIIATGAYWNKLGVPGEEELTGKGVSYCATCDGPLFRNREVVVVGGGDTALEEALFVSKFAKKVTVIHRRESLRATKILQERAKNNEKIAFLMSSLVTKIEGSKKVESVTVKNIVSGKEASVVTDGVFLFVGIKPNSDFVKAVLELDEKGYIKTDSEMRTSVAGIFACGDVRGKNLRQVTTAVGEGATAAFNARHFVERIKGIEYK